MIELRIAGSDIASIRSELLGHGLERCAVALASRHDGNRITRLLVREVVVASDDDYAASGLDHAQLKPEFVARVAKRARLDGLSLVFIHSHPGSTNPEFSAIDDAGEADLAAFLLRRGQTVPHAAMVVSAGGLSARVLGGGEAIRVVSVGDRLVVEYDPAGTTPDADEKFDRQVRALGRAGQSWLESLRVAIVGLGGTGSVIAQQLVHLGIRNFVLIDPDTLETTNLNRVVAARPQDVGKPKVHIAQRYLEEVAPGLNVQAIVGNVVHNGVARQLFDADILLCCTDSHGSRSVVQQVAYQFLIPCIDVGSTITVDSGQVTGIFGRIQLLGPDQPCLWCTSLLNSEQVRRDLMSEFERTLDPYIQGAHEPAPAVISLNSTVVSLGVTMLLGLVTPAPIDAHHLIYNAKSATLRSVKATAAENCFICSRAGVLARGDTQPLFARQD